MPCTCYPNLIQISCGFSISISIFLQRKVNTKSLNVFAGVICRKYYLDVQRREDGFDLSGPCLPKEDPVPLRAVSKFSVCS